MRRRKRAPALLVITVGLAVSCSGGPRTDNNNSEGAPHGSDNTEDIDSEKSDPKLEAEQEEEQEIDPIESAPSCDEAAILNGAPGPTWTYMIYMAADNNLEQDYWMDLNEFSMAKSNQNVNVVVQVDRASSYDTSYGNWTNVKRFHIKNCEFNGQEFNRSRDWEHCWEEMENLNETSTGDPGTLSDFLLWSAREYPADNYVLVVWNHGDSWWSVAQDETEGDSLQFWRGEMAAALGDFVRQNQKLEAILFDACNMASWEVAHDLHDYARYMYGSGSTANYDGISHTMSLDFIADNPCIDGADLVLETARVSDEVSRQRNTGAIDLEGTRLISDAIKALSQTVINDATTAEPLRRAIANARGLEKADGEGDWRTWYIDLKDLASQMERSDNSAIQAHGRSISEAFEDGIVGAYGSTFPHNGSTAPFGGLTFTAYYNSEPQDLEKYAQGSWDTYTQWSTAMRALAGR